MGATSRKVSVFLAQSLDGFIADPAGGVGWLEAFHDPEDDMGWSDFWGSVDALLMGRKSWEVVRQFTPWPYGDTPVYVRTHHPLDATHGERVVAGDITAIVDALFSQGHRHIYVDGGQTSQDALFAGIVDEVTLTTAPVVLGDGIAFFRRGDGLQQWRLLRTRTSKTGLVQAIYSAKAP